MSCLYLLRTCKKGQGAPRSHCQGPATQAKSIHTIFFMAGLRQVASHHKAHRRGLRLISPCSCSSQTQNSRLPRSPPRDAPSACKNRLQNPAARTCSPARGLDLKYLSKGRRRWGRGVLDHESWQDAAAARASPQPATRWITGRRPSRSV